MKFIQSKWFQIGLGVLGIGGSIFALSHYVHWSQLADVGSGIFVLLAASLLEMIFRSLRIQRVCRLVGGQVSFWESSWMAALADIYGAATPSGVGGEVARMTSLARFGVKTRDAMIVLAADRLALLSSLIVVLVSSSIFVIFHQFHQEEDLVISSSLIYTLGLYGFFSIALIGVLYVLLLPSPKSRRQRESAFPADDCTKRAQCVDQTSALTVKKKDVGISPKKVILKLDIFLLAMMHHVVRLGLLPLALFVFNYHMAEGDSIRILMASFVLGYGVSLLPVPSGGGSVEVSFMLIFTTLLGEPLAAQTLIGWRFAGHYFYILVGILMTAMGLVIMPRHASKKSSGPS